MPDLTHRQVQQLHDHLSSAVGMLSQAIEELKDAKDIIDTAGLNWVLLTAAQRNGLITVRDNLKARAQTLRDKAISLENDA